MIAASSAPIRDLESALAALIENPAVDWLDLAMRHLTQISDDHPGAVPPIRLVRVGADGVDLILAEAAGCRPRRLRGRRGRMGLDSARHEPTLAIS